VVALHISIFSTARWNCRGIDNGALEIGGAGERLPGTNIPEKFSRTGPKCLIWIKPRTIDTGPFLKAASLIILSAMKDMQQRLEKLRDDAAECAVIAGLAETREKRELFARLSEHLNALANQVEQAISAVANPDAFLGRQTNEPFPKAGNEEGCQKKRCR
jgi:hypothetical protein